MNNAELVKITVEEFSRLQEYMSACEKDSKVFSLMLVRYNELKIILQALGVSLNELDHMKL